MSSTIFSGLVPQLVGEILVLAGIHSLSFVAERVLFHIGMYENTDEKSVKVSGFYYCLIVLF